MDTPNETPLSDHLDKIATLLAGGARLTIDTDPEDPACESFYFPGVVSKELAMRIADRQAARTHAITLEQTALFIESEPLVEGVMGVAAFLRSLAGDQT